MSPSALSSRFLVIKLGTVVKNSWYPLPLWPWRHLWTASKSKSHVFPSLWQSLKNILSNKVYRQTSAIDHQNSNLLSTAATMLGPKRGRRFDCISKMFMTLIFSLEVLPKSLWWPFLFYRYTRHSFLSTKLISFHLLYNVWICSIIKIDHTSITKSVWKRTFFLSQHESFISQIYTVTTNNLWVIQFHCILHIFLDKCLVPYHVLLITTMTIYMSVPQSWETIQYYCYKLLNCCCGTKISKYNAISAYFEHICT